MTIINVEVAQGRFTVEEGNGFSSIPLRIPGQEFGALLKIIVSINFASGRKYPWTVNAVRSPIFWLSRDGEPNRHDQAIAGLFLNLKKDTVLAESGIDENESRKPDTLSVKSRGGYVSIHVKPTLINGSPSGRYDSQFYVGGEVEATRLGRIKGDPNFLCIGQGKEMEHGEWPVPYGMTVTYRVSAEILTHGEAVEYDESEDESLLQAMKLLRMAKGRINEAMKIIAKSRRD